MSFNWISGGAMVSRFNLERVRARLPGGAGYGGWSGRARIGTPNGRAARTICGPPVTSPDERRSVIRLRTASVMPIDCSVNGLPLGAITSAPAFTQRLASGISSDDDVALAGAGRDPVVGGVHRGPCRNPLDQRILRHPDELAGDHA